MLTNTQSLSLLNAVASAVGESQATGFLERVSSCLSDRAGFEGTSDFFQRAALSGDILAQGEAIDLIFSRPLVRYALASHAESLARAMGMEERIGDSQAAPFSPRDNPIPWWFAARYPERVARAAGTNAAIPFEAGALAIGRVSALRWLMGYREALEAQRLPDGFSAEPYLLWVPDELSQAAFLNVTGGIVPEFGKEFQKVNEPGRLRIRALLPFLAPGDSFVVDRSEEMKRGPVLQEWREGRLDALQLTEFFERKYKTVRKGDDLSPLEVLLPAQSAAWAFQAFQHHIRTPGSDTYAYANEAMKGIGAPWISYDLSTGFFLAPMVTLHWKEIPGLRVFLRGKPPQGMETGVYGTDVRILREGLPEGVMRFFDVLMETLKQRDMQPVRETPTPREEKPETDLGLQDTGSLEFDDTIPGDLSSTDDVEFLKVRHELILAELGRSDPDNAERVLDLRRRADALAEKMRSLQENVSPKET